jgi:two-component system sensor histidine kinase LytS
MNSILNNILGNIAILIILGSLIPRINYFRATLFRDDLHIKDKLILALFFGLIGILSTYTGIYVNGAIVNTRVIGVITGGLLGGPLVGFLAGLIAGSHRLIYEIGGFTSLSCSISTVVEGLIGGLVYFKLKESHHKYQIVFFATMIAEITQMILIVLVARPFEDAISLVKIIGLPMILLNSLGVVIFMESMYSVYRSINSLSAKKLKLAFDITEAASIHLREGFENTEHMCKVAHIICDYANIETVVFTSLEGVLAYSSKDTKYHFESIENISDIIKEVATSHKTAYVKNETLKKFFTIKATTKLYVAPISRNQIVIGTLLLFDDFVLDDYEANQIFVDGLSKFLSTQLMISEIESQKKLTQKAELKALKSQSNPHFLFNALNTISASIRENPERSRELLIALSSYLRNTLSKTDDFVTLQEEIEHVHSYIEIEKARYEERLNFILEYDPKDVYFVPNFIIQPLIENAIKHGFTKNTLTVKLSIHVLDKCIEIIVSDNGKGMDETIINGLYLNQMDQNKIGLSNIHARLKSIYPNNPGVSIESQSNVFTKITIYIPVKGVSE